MAWARRSNFQSCGRMRSRVRGPARRANPLYRGLRLLGLDLLTRCLFGLFLRIIGLRSLSDKPPPLADAGVAPDLAAQIVKPALTDVAVAQHIDLVDARRVNHEGPLDSNTVRHATHREVPSGTCAGDADHSAFEHLDAFARALDDL